MLNFILDRYSRVELRAGMDGVGSVQHLLDGSEHFCLGKLSQKTEVADIDADNRLRYSVV